MKNIKLISLLCMAALIVSLMYGGLTASAQPGDINDPLVSKAYVDSQIEQLRSLIANNPGVPSGGSLSQEEKEMIISEVLGQLFGYTFQPPAEAGITPYDAVFIESGRTLIAESGTEMIMRGGGAVAVTGVNGLCDVTVGADIVNGTTIPLNHLLIVPASDGRGMRFIKDSWVMVKGVYFIVD